MKINKNNLFCFVLTFSYLFLTLVGTKFLAGEGHVLDVAETGESDPLKQILFVLILLLAIFDCFVRGKLSSIKSISGPLYFILAFFVYAFSSTFWSEVPFITFKRIVLTSIVFLIPLLLALSYDRKVLFKNLVTSLTIMVFLSILLSIFHPAAVHTLDTLDEQLVGNWKGLFTHKNRAGAVAAILTGILLISFWVRKDKKYFAFAIVSFLFLVQTVSKTSIFLLVPCFLFVFGLVRFRFITNRYYILVAILVTSPLLYYGLVSFLVLLESPESLTGRAMIWQVVGNIISDNPIFGVGYSSVYHVGTGSILFDYADSWVEFVAHGHNGYLDLVLYLGFVGFFGYLFFFIYPYFRYSLILTREKLSVDDSIIILSSVFVGVFFVLHNMTESSFFDTTRHGWVFFSFFFPILVVMNTYRKD